MNENKVYGELAFNLGRGFVDSLITLLVTTEGFDEARAVAFAKRFTLIWACAFEQIAGKSETPEAD